MRSYNKYERFLADCVTVLNIITAIAILFWALSCQRDTLRDFQYDPDQPTQLTVNVYTVGDAKVNMNNLNLETNADYLNRYGFNANFVPQGNIELDSSYLGEGDTPWDGRIFLPQEKNDSREELNLWVVERFHMMPGIAGYAIGRYNMVVRESHIYGTTVTHEIGHLLGLGHVALKNNVMITFGNREQRADPREFVPEQIDTMLRSLNGYPTEVQSLIID